MTLVRNRTEEVIQIERESKLKEMEMSVVEKRRRLSWREDELSSREVVGRWIDERPLLGDKITLYKQLGKYYLETWYLDGCHSLDEMTSEETEEGTKLEDKGGNIFGEYFMLTTDNELKFCNSTNCYYTAKINVEAA
ncbi:MULTISPECIES: hypothetical protein [unclassified Shewanella]|uniref:hypothetical protein n=1 Tax=unclassified Shewanella TaxID=196818 RepID=UPI001BC792EA|nr:MULTISPECIES: hypothetical protein [unclassified Shewanella]GIU15561.1 hypothetical protein TUM4444_27000 [Shewanella sp. MBTL60-112-B1]GIU35034.1 hypothetical protein TUM4445_24370 [Shewanella sp. MBTL60-112-B2]